MDNDNLEQAEENTIQEETNQTEQNSEELITENSNKESKIKAKKPINKKKLIMTSIIIIEILFLVCICGISIKYNDMINDINEKYDSYNENSISVESTSESVSTEATTSNPFKYVDVKETDEELLLHDIYLTHPYYGKDVKDAYTGESLTASEIDTRWIINYAIWNVQGIVKDYESELIEKGILKNTDFIDSPGVYKISDIENKIYEFFGLNIKLYEFGYGCADNDEIACGGAVKFDSTNTYVYQTSGYGLGSYVTKVNKLISSTKTDNGLIIDEQAVFYDSSNVEKKSDGSYMYKFYNTSTKKTKLGEIVCSSSEYCYFNWDNISSYVDESQALTFEHTFKLVDGIYVWQSTIVK